MSPEIQRSHHATRDPEEAYAVLEQTYAVRRWRLSRAGGFGLRLGTVSLGPMVFEASRLEGAAGGGTLDFTRTIRVSRLVAGQLSLDQHPGHVGRAAPSLLPPALYTDRWDQVEIHSIAFDPATVTHHARALAADPVLVPRFTGTGPLTTARAQHWTRLVDHVRHDVLGNEAVTALPLVLDQTCRSVLTALLQTFPNTFLDAPARHLSTTPAAVRRATAFVDSHLAEPIGLPEIAEAARISPRGLQAAFRRHLATTPTAYLRRARLAAAHDDLVRADPTTGVTVREIAARWGFAHPGRFAAAYRAVHRTGPTTTLHS